MLPASFIPTDPADDHLPDTCRGVSGVLSRVGDKWSVLVVRLLGDGPVRFSDLHRRIGGISKRMLTLTLRNLERDGLVTRHVTPGKSPRVDYSLTPLGQSLWQPVMALADWAIAHKFEIQHARQQFDLNAEDS
jgi:DNA-binding HxlR family transcriptional regulator